MEVFACPRDTMQGAKHRQFIALKERASDTPEPRSKHKATHNYVH